MSISPSDIVIEGDAINIDETTLKKAVQRLKNGRAAGPGGNPAEIIKCGTNKLFERLTWSCGKHYKKQTLTIL